MNTCEKCGDNPDYKLDGMSQEGYIFLIKYACNDGYCLIDTLDDLFNQGAIGVEVTQWTSPM